MTPYDHGHDDDRVAKCRHGLYIDEPCPACALGAALGVWNAIVLLIASWRGEVIPGPA